MQKRCVPSFFLTITTPLDHGLEEGSIISLFNISLTCFSISLCKYSDVLRNGCFIGRESPVGIWCLTMPVRPISISDFEKFDYSYCGKVYLRGNPREAYQKNLKQNEHWINYIIMNLIPPKIKTIAKQYVKNNKG